MICFNYILRRTIKDWLRATLLRAKWTSWLPGLEKKFFFSSQNQIRMVVEVSRFFSISALHRNQISSWYGNKN